MSEKKILLALAAVVVVIRLIPMAFPSPPAHDAPNATGPEPQPYTRYVPSGPQTYTTGDKSEDKLLCPNGIAPGSTYTDFKCNDKPIDVRIVP